MLENGMTGSEAPPVSPAAPNADTPGLPGVQPSQGTSPEPGQIVEPGTVEPVIPVTPTGEPPVVPPGGDVTPPGTPGVTDVPKPELPSEIQSELDMLRQRSGLLDKIMTASDHDPGGKQFMTNVIMGNYDTPGFTPTPSAASPAIPGVTQPGIAQPGITGNGSDFQMKPQPKPEDFMPSGQMYNSNDAMINPMSPSYKARQDAEQAKDAWTIETMQGISQQSAQSVVTHLERQGQQVRQISALDEMAQRIAQTSGATAEQSVKFRDHVKKIMTNQPVATPEENMKIIFNGLFASELLEKARLTGIEQALAGRVNPDGSPTPSAVTSPTGGGAPVSGGAQMTAEETLAGY